MNTMAHQNTLKTSYNWSLRFLKTMLWLGRLYIQENGRASLEHTSCIIEVAFGEKFQMHLNLHAAKILGQNFVSQFGEREYPLTKWLLKQRTSKVVWSQQISLRNFSIFGGLWCNLIPEHTVYIWRIPAHTDLLSTIFRKNKCNTDASITKVQLKLCIYVPRNNLQGSEILQRNKLCFIE